MVCQPCGMVMLLNGIKTKGTNGKRMQLLRGKSEHLPDGSANNDIQDGKEKEMLPEDNTSEDHVGLTIEENDDVNRSEESSSSGSSEEI